MDVMLLSGNSLRVKGKSSTLIVNPTTDTNKTEADGIINLGNSTNFSEAKIAESRITVKGPGEYEVGGTKISALGVDGKLVARIDVDSVKVLVGSGQSIEKVQDKIEEPDLIVVDADEKFNYSSLTSLGPKVLLVFGALKEEVGKSLGKESIEKLNKYSTSADKLPQELQINLLG